MIELPTGEELDQALAARHLSTAGLPLNANGVPLESAKQRLLSDALRDERDQRILEATVVLGEFTKSLVGETRGLRRATWAVALVTFVLALITVAQIFRLYRPTLSEAPKTTTVQPGEPTPGAAPW